MAESSSLPWLADILEAAGHIGSVIENVAVDAFEIDWQKRWLVERGVEIISEASRHLPHEIKTRHPEIPWPKVAGIGNVLRHDYERIALAILRKLAYDDLPPLEAACRAELLIAKTREAGGTVESDAKDRRAEPPSNRGDRRR